MTELSQYGENARKKPPPSRLMATDLAEVLETATRTDAGTVRPHNEDAVMVDARLGLAVLADGMGGYSAGEVASGMATALLAERLDKAFAEHGPDEHLPGAGGRARAVLRSEIGAVNAAIYQAAQSQPQCAGMGTTLVAALFHDNGVTVAHVGDSRLYRWRAGELLQLTRDHSLLQEQIDSGIISAEQARNSRNKNLVTRALGVDPTVEADLADHGALPGDVYLLCSDGLSDMVGHDDIALCLSSLAANPESCAARLVKMANDNGGRDNVSVVLVRVKRAFPAARGWWARLLAWFK